MSTARGTRRPEARQRATSGRTPPRPPAPFPAGTLVPALFAGNLALAGLAVLELSRLLWSPETRVFGPNLGFWHRDAAHYATREALTLALAAAAVVLALRTEVVRHRTGWLAAGLVFAVGLGYL